MGELISLRGVSKKYGAKTVLDHIDLSVKENQSMLLQGIMAAGRVRCFS